MFLYVFHDINVRHKKMSLNLVKIVKDIFAYFPIFNILIYPKDKYIINKE